MYKGGTCTGCPPHPLSPSVDATNLAQETPDFSTLYEQTVHVPPLLSGVSPYVSHIETATRKIGKDAVYFWKATGLSNLYKRSVQLARFRFNLLCRSLFVLFQLTPKPSVSY